VKSLLFPFSSSKYHEMQRHILTAGIYSSTLLRRIVVFCLYITAPPSYCCTRPGLFTSPYQLTPVVTVAPLATTARLERLDFDWRLAQPAQPLCNLQNITKLIICSLHVLNSHSVSQCTVPKFNRWPGLEKGQRKEGVQFVIPSHPIPPQLTAEKSGYNLRRSLVQLSMCKQVRFPDLL
jgi:hypothetical protein